MFVLYCQDLQDQTVQPGVVVLKLVIRNFLKRVEDSSSVLLLIGIQLSDCNLETLPIYLTTPWQWKGMQLNLLLMLLCALISHLLMSHPWVLLIPAGRKRVVGKVGQESMGRSFTSVMFGWREKRWKTGLPCQLGVIAQFEPLLTFLCANQALLFLDSASNLCTQQQSWITSMCPVANSQGSKFKRLFLLGCCSVAAEWIHTYSNLWL